MTYEYGSNRDTGEYNETVLVPAVDVADALSLGEPLAERYHTFWHQRADYRLEATLSHQTLLFASRERLTDHYEWRAKEGDSLLRTRIEPPQVREPEPVFWKKVTLGELKAGLDV